MKKQIDWQNECEKIADDLAEEVCRKFTGNEQIFLDTCRPISAGAVYGLLEQKNLNDEYNTVVITYCIIDRKDIVLDKSVLYQAATKEMNNILKHPDWQVIEDDNDFRKFLREKAEWAVGTKLQHIFSAAACAAPDKYPQRKTHGHAVRKITLEDLKNEKTVSGLKNFDFALGSVPQKGK